MGGKAEAKKRARSPPYAPFVEHYAPYSSGQLRRACLRNPVRSDQQHWDLYYRCNTVNGYKDRHYILREFAELREAIARASANTGGGTDGGDAFSWLEAGCGVGNAMLPVFEESGHLPQWRSLLGFDISSVAISLLRKKIEALPVELAKKVHVCVLDPCERDVTDCPFFDPDDKPEQEPEAPSASAVVRSPRNKVEFASMVFVLCSIPVAQHRLVLRRVAACMTRPTGVFFFRDYCVCDQAERRFQERNERSGKESAVEANNTYVRANGTLSHFFSLEEVRQLFVSVGFTVLELREVENEVQNRKRECVFHRKFVQGRFRLTELSQAQGG